MKPDEINEIAAHLNHLLEEVEARADPEVAATVAQLVDGLQRIHAEGLRRLVELLTEEPELFGRALDEPVISNLFYLYDLAVVDAEERVREALESVRVMARSHGGEIELMGVEDGVVRLRVRWSHDSVARDEETLRDGIEWALRERLPGFRRVEVEGLDAGRSAVEGTSGAAATGGGPGPLSAPSSGKQGRGGVPDGRSLPVLGQQSVVSEEKMERLQRRMEEAKERAAAEGLEAREPRWLEVTAAEDVSEAGLHGRLVDDVPVLLVRRGGELLAFRNLCPGSMLPLHFGELEDGELHCPWHGCRFDVASGERLEGDGPPLQRLPVEVDSDVVRVRVRETP